MPYQIVDGDPIVHTLSTPEARALRLAVFSPGDLPPIPSPKQLTEHANQEARVIVCEPVPASGVSEQAGAFAAGCGDYLDLHVGGQPHLGRTPAFVSIIRALREIRAPDGLRLPLSEATKVAQKTGANRVVVGTTVAGKSPGELRIEYSIYDVATGKPIGEPLAISGTPPAIIHALPHLADAMSRRLGVSSPQPSKETSLSPNELSALGRVLWTNAPGVVDPKAVANAADRDPLAMICTLSQECNGDSKKFAADLDLLLTKLAPENAAVWAEAAHLAGHRGRPFLTGIATLRAKYPNNYCLAYADFWISSACSESKRAWTAALAEIRNAPRDPEAFAHFGYSLSSESAAIRLGRTTTQIDRADRPRLYSLYRLWEFCEVYATMLDPQHESAWPRVVRSAVVAGDKKRAVDAYTNAETFTAHKSDAFDAGIEMFDARAGAAIRMILNARRIMPVQLPMTRSPKHFRSSRHCNGPTKQNTPMRSPQNAGVPSKLVSRHRPTTLSPIATMRISFGA